jgi:hypothetical protein
MVVSEVDTIFVSYRDSILVCGTILEEVILPEPPQRMHTDCDVDSGIPSGGWSGFGELPIGPVSCVLDPLRGRPHLAQNTASLLTSFPQAVQYGNH